MGKSISRPRRRGTGRAGPWERGTASRAQWPGRHHDALEAVMKIWDFTLWL